MNQSKIILVLLISVISLFCLFIPYKVNFGQQTIVYRFGKIIHIRDQMGLYLKSPLDKIFQINMNKIRRLEIGFRTDLSKKQFSDEDAIPQLWEMKHISISKEPSESLVITKDENIVDVNCVIHYEINNIKDYMININNSEKFIRNLSEASIRILLGKEDLEEILVENKYKLQNDLQSDIQKLLNQYKAGINIIKINMQDIHPPVDVVHSFRDVTSAREDKNTAIHEALEYGEKIIPEARAEAHKMKLNAEATKEEVILKSLGDQERFLKIKPLYTSYSKHLKLKKYYDYIAKTYKYTKIYIISHKLFEHFEFFKEQGKNDTEEEFIDEIQIKSAY